jgi:hypothetical protein
LHAAFPFQLYADVWLAVAGRTETLATPWLPRDTYSQAALLALEQDLQEEGEDQHAQTQGGEKEL